VTYGSSVLFLYRIRIIYLMSGTQGMVTQSPEPDAHDTRI